MCIAQILTELPRLSHAERREVSCRLIELEEEAQTLADGDRRADANFQMLDALEAQEDAQGDHPRRFPRKREDRYLKFVRWSEKDGHYVGYCPDLFPWGGVCHGADEERTYQQLGELVREETAQLVASGAALPVPATRPMRELAGA